MGILIEKVAGLVLQGLARYSCCSQLENGPATKTIVRRPSWVFDYSIVVYNHDWYELIPIYVQNRDPLHPIQLPNESLPSLLARF